MMGFRSWVVIVAVCFGARSANATCEEGCWETCFQQINTELERYTDVWDRVLEIGLEITHLKNIYNTGKIGWVVDSAVSSRHNVVENLSSTNLESGTSIYQFQVKLAMILNFIVNGAHNYLVQYDEESAWSCNEFTCLTSPCQTVAAMNKLTSVEMLPTSHCNGNLEAGCNLLNKLMTDNTCSAPNENTMIVTIANGDFFLNHRQNDQHEDHLCPPRHWGSSSSSGSSSSGSSEEFHHFSPCYSHFQTRYAIATHEPSREVMERFPSKHGNYRFLHDDEFSNNALDSLLKCMLTPGTCCAAVDYTEPTVTTCLKTQGVLGEVANPFATSASITAGQFTLGASLAAYQGPI